MAGRTVRPEPIDRPHPPFRLPPSSSPAFPLPPPVSRSAPHPRPLDPPWPPPELSQQPQPELTTHRHIAGGWRVRRCPLRAPSRRAAPQALLQFHKARLSSRGRPRFAPGRPPSMHWDPRSPVSRRYPRSAQTRTDVKGTSAPRLTSLKVLVFRSLFPSPGPSQSGIPPCVLLRPRSSAASKGLTPKSGAFCASRTKRRDGGRMAGRAGQGRGPGRGNEPSSL